MTETDSATTIVDGTCVLSWPEQRRNLVLFAACTSLHYLAGPILYVGITQASLCKLLGADTRTSNLPTTLFFAMTATPALLAWLSPRVSVLKRNLTLCYIASALMMICLATVLILPIDNSVKLGIVILQAGVSGATMPAAMAFLWELIGRGAAESRRGLALSLAFGLGPVLAVISSFGQAGLLGGELFGIKFQGVAYPNNFVILFGVGAPIMLLGAVLSQFFIVPPAEHEVEREPISGVIGLLYGLPLMLLSVALVQAAAFTGQDALRYAGYATTAGATAAFVYHFRSILQQRVLLLATVVTILLYMGNSIPPNMNLYSASALDRSPAEYAGLQNMLRFGCKVVAGAGLGWMLTRTNPRAGVVATGVIFLASQVWATLVTGPWYLVAFGLFGAGELIGVYAPNYIVAASRQSDLRRNMAFMTMLMAPAAPAGYLYGAIVDFVKAKGWTALGLTSESLGFRLSFVACGLLILCGIVIAVTRLPKRPRPE